jgi:hypothetical protein
MGQIPANYGQIAGSNVCAKAAFRERSGPLDALTGRSTFAPGLSCMRYVFSTDSGT